MPFYSNVDIQVDSGQWKQPNGPLVIASPTRNIAAGATDGGEVNLHEITSPILITGFNVTELRVRTEASGASGTITVTYKVYIDDILVATLNQSATAAGVDAEDALYPSTLVSFDSELFAPKWKVTTEVTQNSIDTGTSVLRFDDATGGQLNYHPVVG